MHKTSRLSIAIITVLVIALSSAAIVALWLYSQPDLSLLNHERLLVILMQAMVIIPILIGITFISSRYASRQKKSNSQMHQLQQQLQQRTAELQNSQFQTEQINRQLQLSVSHANMITQQAVEANKAKGEFLSNMSHQIRTPMNAIIGFSEMLAEENLDADQKKQVRIIRDSSRHLLQLINDILDFSKIEAGRLDLDMADITVESILAAAQSLMQPAAAEKGLQFEIIRNQPMPKFIRTDPSRLKQCLLNLVGNAVRFTQNGYVHIKVSSEHQDDKSFIRFDVEDSGVGIPADKLDNVFEPFSQFDSGGMTRPLGSTGLGLAITKHIVELLGGKLTARSAFGKGSIFSLFVPAASESKQLPDNKNISPAAEQAPVKTRDNSDIRFTGRVLVVEDSPTNQMLIDLILKKIGLQTELVENGLQAIQKAAAGKFDVVLMDIQMPVMNGYEATRQLRKDGLKIPIIALTACAMKGDDEKCFAAGCSDYLAKPIDRKKLIDALAKYLPAQGVKQPSQIVQNNTEDKKENTMENPEVAVAVDQCQLEVDWQLLMERIGDESLIDEILPIFLKDNQERMLLLAEAVKKTDSKEVKFFAHSIKGASGAIGASRIFELGKELENAARDEQPEKYVPLFEQIKTHFDSLLIFLDNKDWKLIAKAAAASHNQKAS